MSDPMIRPITTLFDWRVQSELAAKGDLNARARLRATTWDKLEATLNPPAAPARPPTMSELCRRAVEGDAAAVDALRAMPMPPGVER